MVDDWWFYVLCTKMIPMSPCRSSFEAALVFWQVCGVDDEDDGGFYFRNETGRTAWEVKERAVLGIGELPYQDVGMGNVLSVKAEVAWFLLGCGCFSGYGWVCGWDWGGVSLQSFFFPSFAVSPLSLLLFRFVEVSMTLGCSSGGCCFFFFFLDDASDWETVLVTANSVVTAVVSIDVTFVAITSADVDAFAVASAIVTVVVVFAVDDWTGDYFCSLYELPGFTPLLFWGSLQFPGWFRWLLLLLLWLLLQLLQLSLLL